MKREATTRSRFNLLFIGWKGKMSENKVVLIDRHENELQIIVKGEIIAFIWNVTGIDKGRIMRQGKVAGTLNPNTKIQEKW